MADRLEFVHPVDEDWRQFLLAAEEEGWRVPAFELQLFRRPLADSALALRNGGRFAGLVTLINHGKSAWIGNLIVPEVLRGKGYGKMLLDQAILRLEEQGTRSIWLTASEAGFPLYRRRGFELFGQVERWVLSEGGASGNGVPCCKEAGNKLYALETAVWGEQRALLELLFPRGKALHCGSNVALLQQEPGMQILGPWYAASTDREEQRGLLDSAIAVARAGEELVIDVRAGAIPEQVLAQAGFVLRGHTRLMVRGDADDIDLLPLVSFASLGSMG